MNIDKTIGRPKRATLEQLKSEAGAWAEFLYTLRDGQPGLLEKVKWNPFKSATSGEGKKIRMRTSRVVCVKIVPLKATKAGIDELTKQVTKQFTKQKGWVFFSPVLPNLAAWERFKKARTVLEVRRAAGMMRVEYFYLPRGLSKPASVFIREHAKDLLLAKKLPHYPRRAASNDDKRVVFFAKVLAGLSLGIRPLYATKKLGHWDWSKDHGSAALREFTASVTDAQHAQPLGT